MRSRACQVNNLVGNGTIVYITWDDCAVEAKRVLANGGKIMKEKFAIGQYGFIALVTDLEWQPRLNRRSSG